MAKPTKPDDKEQSRLFIETAREIGADEEVSAADKVLGRLAKQQPEPRKLDVSPPVQGVSYKTVDFRPQDNQRVTPETQNSKLLADLVAAAPFSGIHAGQRQPQYHYESKADGAAHSR
jgi:hypothetical protein